MNSCRNCTNAKHDGAFNPALYCKDLRTQVAPATSMSTEENKAQDKRLINRANTCGAYKGEANATDKP